MNASADTLTLADRMGHKFNNLDLLREALTHASMASPTRAHNQRLEFLGDRVLGLVIAEALLANDAAASEGDLAPRLNALVRKETCADIARDLNIGDALKLGRSEMLSGGRRKEALLGDAMEAVIAAVYLDAGYPAARDMILRLWSKRIKTVKADARDPKTSLQEWAQARKMPPPEYREVSRKGPDHAPLFEIAAVLKDGSKATATAGSKRQAEQDAARALLAQLESAS
ncbi:ribonuclease III [Alphaproteobacteria bacterium KMM 3653]|uniref:Ribonuclease 3 n=1 Tax=Harenicola maris TaxID=2841044 RepID=A0AAP2G5R7_9RHOB|nr:ribonuclease III [Harenicola maris]